VLVPCVTVIFDRSGRRARLVEMGRAAPRTVIRVAAEQVYLGEPHEVRERETEIDDDGIARAKDARGIYAHLPATPNLASAVASEIVNVRTLAENARVDAPLQLHGKEEDGNARKVREVSHPLGMAVRVEEPEVGDTVVRGSQELQLGMKVEMVRDEGRFA